MQSEKVGVSSVILDKSPKAIVTHCWSYDLNLTIAQCADIQVINNIIEQHKALQIYFQTSLQRKSLLEHIVSLYLHDVCQRNVLTGMCSTRWSERDVLYEHFYLAVSHMAEAFEVMDGTHPVLRSFKKIYADGWKVM